MSGRLTQASSQTKMELYSFVEILFFSHNYVDLVSLKKNQYIETIPNVVKFGFLDEAVTIDIANLQKCVSR